VCGGAIPDLCCGRREEGFIGLRSSGEAGLVRSRRPCTCATFLIICASDSDRIFPARSARRDDYEAYDDYDDDEAAAATVVRRSPAKYLSR
jgi:hypothetical protein